MRIKELRIRQFQVINEVDLLDLSDFVVIAGPNGVGKTKIKEAISHIFQNQGNPPAGSQVVLEATSPEEEKAWKSKEVALPNQGFLDFFNIKRKKIKTQTRLINIDSARQIESVSFDQINFSQIGNPDDEEVDMSYGLNRVKDRFKDICQTLQRKKLKLLTDYGTQAHTQSLSAPGKNISIIPLVDPTAEFIDLFNTILYPKKMAQIDTDSSTIQYYDESNTLRPFSELSSGEKEVIVLTFDILLQSPSDCIVLIDEPEIHLHPELTFRLMKVLKSIGERNQFFLFTHSADIIGNSFETGIHFIRPKSKVPTGNQAIRIDSNNIDDLKLIPNLRETIGMISLGKKLLFIEGASTSIDRNVFSTLAKSLKTDLAIIPSDTCTNINNMSLIAETLSKGVHGIELFMLRDRDSLTEDQVNIFTTKSKGKLIFLPFYHIENTFLVPEALHYIAKKIGISPLPTVQEINEELVKHAKDQINFCIELYVKNEINFTAGNFDSTPLTPLTSTSTVEEIVKAINNAKDIVIDRHQKEFAEDEIKKKVEFWKDKLEKSIASGWSEDARKLFYGKKLLSLIKSNIFKGKNINVWEEIINDEKDPSCLKAVEPLKDILNKL